MLRYRPKPTVGAGRRPSSALPGRHEHEHGTLQGNPTMKMLIVAWFTTSGKATDTQPESEIPVGSETDGPVKRRWSEKLPELDSNQ